MIVDGNEGTFIEGKEAVAMTKAYQNDNPGKVKARLFGKNKINDLLEQEGCEGIRAYFAKASDGKNALVIVGVDASGNDILDLYLDRGNCCPNDCDTNSSPLVS